MSPILESLANASARGYGVFSAAPAAPAFDSIATANGTGSSNTITFSAIPAGYKSLQIRFIAKIIDNTTNYMAPLWITFNGSSATAYAAHRANPGSASSVVASTSNSATQIATSSGNGTNGITGHVVANSTAAWANMFGVGIIDIIDYSSTTKSKTIKVFGGVEVNDSSNYGANWSSGLWYATPAAITSITFTIPTGFFGSSSYFTTTTQFALYGIKGA